jgi:hypothetical protein
MTDCNSVRELITQELHDRIEADDRKALEAHLGQCPECTRWKEEIGAARGALKDLEEIPLPADLADKVRSSFEGPRKTARIMTLLLTAAAGMLLGIGLTLLLTPSHETVTPVPEKPAVDVAKGIAEHLHASRLFFRQAGKVVGSRAEADQALLDRELEMTQLEKRTRELREASDDPEIVAYLEAVSKALQAVRTNEIAAIPEKLDKLALLDRIEKLKKTKGIEPAPIPVTMSPDQDVDSYSQARACLYTGNYDRARALLGRISRNRAASYREDALYWLVTSPRVKRDFMWSLIQLAGLFRGRYGDIEMAREVKRIAEEAGAIIDWRPAAQVTPEEIQTMFRNRAEAGAFETDDGGRIYVVGVRADPEMQELRRVAMKGTREERRMWQEKLEKILGREW